MEKRKVIFLDIDGVLQPTTYENRFNHDLDKLCEDLSLKYQDENYLEIDKYDVGAVYYDWKEEAVNNLKRLLDETKAEIVLSSTWKRYNTFDNLKRLFKIHELDTFLVEIVPFVQYEGNKKDDLIKYLNNHPDLTRYVVIDDMNMEEFFSGHFVHTKRMGFFDEDSLKESIRILECEDISI